MSTSVNSNTEAALNQRMEITRFLSMLSANDIDYCILNPFPEKDIVPKTDLDIFIDKTGIRQTESFLSKNNWKSEINFRFNNTRRYFSKITNGFKLKLDISLDYAVFSEDTHFSYANLPNKQRSPDGFSYLDDYSGFFFIMKKALIKGYLSPEKRDELEIIANRCAEIADLAPNLINNMASNWRLFAPIVDGGFIPTNSGKFSALNWIVAHTKRLCLAKGALNIAFIGLDGAGKGTYIAMLKEELAVRNIYFREVYLGYSAYRFAPLRAVVRMKFASKGYIANKLLMAAYLLLLPIDFVIRRGYGKYDLLIADRHPLFEPVFTHWIFKPYDRLISFICPPANLIFYLCGDAWTLWQRKRECEFDQYVRRKTQLEDLLKTQSAKLSIIEIDSTKDICDVFNNVIEEIERHAKHHCVNK